MGGNRSSINILKTTRAKFRAGMLRVLYKMYLHDFTQDGFSSKKAKVLASKRLKQDLYRIRFCSDTEIRRLIVLIPIVREALRNVTRKRKRDRKKMISSTIICTILLMLYHGYVLSEQSDESIPDMLATLKQILGSYDGEDAYRYVVYIASSDCGYCSRLRRFFLFGDDL